MTSTTNILFTSPERTTSHVTTHVSNTTTWLPGNVSYEGQTDITLLPETTESIISTRTREHLQNTSTNDLLRNFTSSTLINNSVPEVIIMEPEVHVNLKFENVDSVLIGAAILVACLVLLALMLRFSMPFLKLQLRKLGTRHQDEKHLDDTDRDIGHVSDMKFGAHAWGESSSSGSIESSQSQDWSDVSSSQTKITDDGEESQSKSSYHFDNTRISPPASVHNQKGSTHTIPELLSIEILDPTRLEHRTRPADHWEYQSSLHRGQSPNHVILPPESRLRESPSVTSLRSVVRTPSVASVRSGFSPSLRAPSIQSMVSSASSAARFPIPTRDEVQHILQAKSRQNQSKFVTINW